MVELGDVAAWTQAIGSVAAIWFAGRFGHRDRLHKVADQVQAVHGLTTVAAKMLANAANGFNLALTGDNRELNEFPVEAFKDMEQMLAAIPVLEIGGLDTPEVLLALRDDVRMMGLYVRGQAHRSYAPDADTFNAVVRIAGRADTVARRTREWSEESEAAAKRWWR